MSHLAGSYFPYHSPYNSGQHSFDKRISIMAWVNFGSLKFWIGSHPKLGAVVLPPRTGTYTSPEAEHVELFVAAQNKFSKFQPEIARTKISSAISEEDALNAVQAYLSFLHSAHNSFTIENRPSLTLSRYTTERETHCYNCKKHLSSAINFSCGSCQWIVCPNCGACGCGYSKN